MYNAEFYNSQSYVSEEMALGKHFARVSPTHSSAWRSEDARRDVLRDFQCADPGLLRLRKKSTQMHEIPSAAASSRGAYSKACNKLQY